MVPSLQPFVRRLRDATTAKIRVYSLIIFLLCCGVSVAMVRFSGPNFDVGLLSLTGVRSLDCPCLNRLQFGLPIVSHFLGRLWNGHFVLNVDGGKKLLRRF